MTVMRDLPDLLTRAEAAEMMRVSIRTLDRLLADGDLRATRPSRRRVYIARAEVVRHLRAHRGRAAVVWP